MRSEYRPTRRTWILWAFLALPLAYIGLVVYVLAARHGEIQGQVTGTVDPIQLAVVSLLIVCLMWVHEGVHGIFMLVCGARPQFGILHVGPVPYAFYTTDPGHRFTRRQFLSFALAPLVILGLLGIPLCMLPFGAYLVVPFVLHLGGCIGDIAIAWQVLKHPPTVMCEDLRDGVRFWGPAALARRTAG
ncbi:MAG: DUF3267 domain-containing protein [Candidatus Limnocylindrales bacterium]